MQEFMFFSSDLKRKFKKSKFFWTIYNALCIYKDNLRYDQINDEIYKLKAL